MYRRFLSFVLSTLAVAGGVTDAAAQSPAATIDAAMRRQVVERAIAALRESYIFSDVAERMATDIHARLERGEFDAVTNGPAFAELLTLRLQEVSADRHLSVQFSPEPVPDRDPESAPTPEQIAQFKQFAKKNNFGFGKLDILPGNIGYLALHGFTPPIVAGETAATAMSYLSNTDALIVDLRQNGGGDPAMVAFLCSYFFDSIQPVHLNDLYYRETDKTEQYSTLPYVPGPRYTGKDVYVLTSDQTFSAGEEFTYNLKNLKRATIVGETTGGGANPGKGVKLAEHFAIFVPNGRAINPITKTNWEGTGVEPDIKVPADLALETAQLDAAKKLVAKETNPRFKGSLERRIGELERQIGEMRAKLPPEPVPSAAGNTTFRLVGAAYAHRVAVAGSFNDWNPTATTMFREGDAWVARVDLPAGKTTYKFVVDGRFTIDPANPTIEEDGRGHVNSVIVR
jgi:hypothetical protein